MCSLKIFHASPRRRRRKRKSSRGLIRPTPAAILREEHIDLSSDDDLADDALEQLIKSKEEAEIFNNLPLFDVAIIHNFIDEWFDTPNLNFEDLQLPIGLSVAFHGAIAAELALAQKIVELKHKIDYEKA